MSGDASRERQAGTAEKGERIAKRIARAGLAELEERLAADAEPRDAIPRLAPGAALIVTLLLSVGLWGAIWLGVSALAAMRPW